MKVSPLSQHLIWKSNDFGGDGGKDYRRHNRLAKVGIMGRPSEKGRNVFPAVHKKRPGREDLGFPRPGDQTIPYPVGNPVERNYQELTCNLHCG